MTAGMAETGVIVMVALLTLRTQALLSSTIQGAGHMRGDKSGRYGNNGVADQIRMEAVMRPNGVCGVMSP